MVVRVKFRRHKDRTEKATPNLKASRRKAQSAGADTLCDPSLMILVRASQRDSGSLLPLPDRGDLDRLIGKLARRGYVKEHDAAGLTAPTWRTPRGKRPQTLTITREGLEALNLEPWQHPLMNRGSA